MKTAGFGKSLVQLHADTKSYLELVQEKVAHLELLHSEDAFLLADLGEIVRRHEKWHELLPRVEPFYAVKCNGDPAVLKMLDHLGVGFDCASKEEISSILNLGVDPSRIVFANPCKASSFIRYAAKEKVDLMTFDNEDELRKTKNIFPNAKLLLRILPPADFKVKHKLGNKYGCHPDDAPALLRRAKDLGLNVIGVSFHVGSGLEEAEAFSAAVEVAAAVFSAGAALGFDFTLLDVGGGFPGYTDTAVSFEECATVLRTALDKWFPPKRNVRLIAEPGRYFVTTAFSLTVNIIAKRKVPTYFDIDNADDDEDGKGAFMYYVNDGLFGTFNNIILDHAAVIRARLVNAPVNPMEFVTSVWGPTCDGLDQILKNTKLPELEVGDFLNFPDMGAYTICCATGFNGMPPPDVFYHCSEALWAKVFPAGVERTKPWPVVSDSGRSPRVMKAGHELDTAGRELPASPPAVCMLDDE